MIFPAHFCCFTSSNLNKSEIELRLVNTRIGRQIDISEMCLDLVQDLFLRPSQSLGDFRMYPQRCLLDVIHMLAEPCGFGKDLKTNGLR